MFIVAHLWNDESLHNFCCGVWIPAFAGTTRGWVVARSIAALIRISKALLLAFQMPRTVWLPADVPADAVTYYAGLLEKVSKTPEWQEFVTRTAPTGKFM